MKNLIDRDELLSFLDSRAGFYDFIEDLAKEYSDYNMTSLLEFAEEIMDGFTNAVKGTEVVEEREETSCICSTVKEEAYDCFYDVYYYTCGHCFESIETEVEEDNLKFCPYCGAKYTKIVKEN